MDVDPDLDNGEDAGAIEANSDDYEAGNHDGDNNPQFRKIGRSGKRQHKDSTDDEAGKGPKPSNLHPDDPGNFLKLCTALKILVSREITNSQIETAQGLLQSYCQELVSVSNRLD
jgi:hypothetical protein